MDYVRKNWWKFIVLILFIIICCCVANVHEHWSDEAQSFLLARDNNLIELIYWMQYEGTPPLWVIIIKIFIMLGGTYETFYLLPIIFSSIGVAIFEFKIKAPWYIKILFPFTYFILYQNTIVTRSYCLVLPILMTLICNYDKRIQKPILFSSILFIFMNISLHTLIIAGSLYVLFLVDVYKDNKFKNKKIIIASCLIFIELLITALCTYPNSDCTYKANGGKNIFHIISEATVSSYANIVIEIIITFSVIGILIFSNKDNKEKRIKSTIRMLILFVPVLMVYMFINYQIWHIGIIFLLILSYSVVNNTINTKEIIRIFFTVVFIIQILWSICAICYDYKNDYSGSKAVAEYIKNNNYEDKIIFGLGYNVTGIQPYFEKNIFSNRTTDKAFYFWKKGNGYSLMSNDTADMYVIIDYYKYFSKLINWMEENNYKRIDFNGHTYSKTRIYESEGYMVFVKNDNKEDN